MKLWRHPIRTVRKAVLEARYDYTPEPLDSERLSTAVVFVPKRVGDGMAIFPAIRALQAHNVAQIIIVASHFNAALFEPLSTDGLEIVSIADAKNHRALRKAAQDINARHGRIDLCIEATMRNNATAICFVGSLKARSNLNLSNSHMKCYSPLSRHAQALHDSEAPRPWCWAALMKDIGIAEVIGNYEFPIPEAIDEAVSAELAPLGPYIALNMDGSKPARQLTLEQGQAICERLSAQYHLPIVTVCGPDGEMKARSLAQSLDEVLRPSFPLSLQHSAAIVKHAAMVVTPDTSILHMASAFNRPVLGLFARRQDRWRPLSDQSAMLVTGDHLHHLDMQELTSVLASLSPETHGVPPALTTPSSST